MKALIIGTGAVGCAVAIATIDGGMETAVLARSETAEYLREHGLKRTGIFGDITIPADRFTVYEDYAKIPSGYEYVIVAVKTLANEDVARELNTYSDILGQTGRIVIFQNGWGNDVPFLEYFPARQVFNARVITGFERIAPGVTNVTVHTAPILLGSLHGVATDELESLAQAISNSGIPSQVSGELEEALWAKMLYNTTLNPLGAILNMSYGQLSSSQNLISIMNRMIDETFAVIDAAGYKTFWKNAEEYKEVFYGKLVPDTFAHRSSTLQDIEKGNLTEIGTLNGCIIRLGEEFDVPTPTHHMIVQLIRGIEDIRCKS
ncbi:ketopantoate reductase [Lachnospiraceae bacterium]|nr:ketopantoate reductase [Lachnospiraceae bacterium]